MFQVSDDREADKEQRGQRAWGGGGGGGQSQRPSMEDRKNSEAL